MVFFQPQGNFFRNAQDFLRAVFSGNRAFPYNADPPAVRQELFRFFLIPLPVPEKLVLPEFRICPGKMRLGAVFVEMPETAVYKNDGVVFWQNDVGLSRQFPVIFPEPEPCLVQLAPDEFFRFGIAALYAGHIVMPLLRGKGVHSFIR